MIIPHAYQGRRIGVFGLARTGVAALNALKAAGADVVGFDDDPVRAATLGDCTYDFLAHGLKGFDGLVLAPGVPTLGENAHPIVKLALGTGVPLLSDFDLFESARSEFSDHTVIAVTGTNGKSTTTALISHILKAAGRPVQTGGNIGTAIMELKTPEPGEFFVIEASSFQLELTQAFSSDIAILLNITSDHLDRHLDMDTYVKAKARLFALQQGGRAIVSADDTYCRGIADNIMNPIMISTGREQSGGVWALEGMLFDDMTGERQTVGRLDEFERLVGEHNHQNITAAFATCKIAGLSTDEIWTGIKSFPGLAHRQELVACVDDVSYVNDSKATNMDAASRALASFDNILWIAGGRPKGSDIDPVLSYLKNVKHIYLNGEAVSVLKGQLSENCRVSTFDSLKEAVAAASRDAIKGDTVLLSPGCTAFDQFANFEVRGEFFRQCVDQCADMLSSDEKRCRQ